MSLSAALAAYYALDESSGTATASDSHSNAAHLSTVTGTPTVVDPGHVGKARQFSGADVRVTQGADEAAVRLGYDRDWTVAFWLKYDAFAIPGGVTCVALQRDNEFQVTYTTVGGDAIRFLLGKDNSGPDWELIDTFASVGSNVWIHYVFRFNGTTKRCRLDINTTNVHDATAPTLAGGQTYNTGAASNRLSVGTQADGGIHQIDEVGVWSSATGGGGELDDADVVDLYNSGAGRDYAYVSAAGGGSGAARRRRLLLRGG